MNTKQIHIADYNYPLPDERIAKFPLAERDSSKLLIYNKGVVTEDVFTSLPGYIPSGSLMVFNNTKVIQARLHFRKESPEEGVQGALIEVFCLEPYQMPVAQSFERTEQCTWTCFIGNNKKWKEGPLTRELDIDGNRITSCS